MHTDFKYSTDLRSYLQEICFMLNLKYHSPPLRIAHRWLSAYDVTVTNMPMLDAFTLLYSAWVPATLRTTYKLYTQKITDTLSAQIRRIHEIITSCRSKNLTDDERKRKLRIVEKIFYQRDKTLLFMNMYTSVLPMFKSFVLILEQNEPMIHRLHDEQTDLFRDFLACFVKH